MADEEREEGEAQGGSSKLVSSLITAGLLVLVPAVLALATYNFVLRPLFSEEAAEPPKETVEAIPDTVVSYDFPEAQVSVVEEDPDVTAPLLIYQVSFSCLDEQTRLVIEERKSYFTAAVLKLHSGRTRAELNDPYVRDTILKQARQEANALLQRFDPGGDLTILEAMHVKFAVVDL